MYSIDEVFIDCTPYLQFYSDEAERQSRQKGSAVHPAHVMAMTIIRDVLKTTGITATVGIGTNLFGKQGKYEPVTGIVRKVDPARRVIILFDSGAIPVEDVVEIRSSVFDSAFDG